MPGKHLRIDKGASAATSGSRDVSVIVNQPRWIDVFERSLDQAGGLCADLVLQLLRLMRERAGDVMNETHDW